ncbi:hypothetical protein Cantr_10642 [Candida viswanathii]|uniref:Stress-activated map kinase-interacting protein 1 n=1 Tax=Candida viswanathii TaxID=5486 RepID=A0A367YDT1_9ASCO|nr:hypothetical protein Cantr_10642 [Candida viswanathii]
MAFPLDQQHLISHLRTSYLLLDEDSEYTRKIITPIPLPDTHSKIVPKVPDSPPITFEIARHVKKSVHNNTKFNDSFNSLSHIRSPKKTSKKQKKKKRPRRKPKEDSFVKESLTPDNANTSTITLPKEEHEHEPQGDDTNNGGLPKPDSLDFPPTDPSAEYAPESIISDDLTQTPEANNDETPMNEESPGDSNNTSTSSANFGLRYTKTIRGTSGHKKQRSKSRTKIPIVNKFFQSGKQDSSQEKVSDTDSDSDSDVEQRRMKLYPAESFSSLDHNNLEEVTTEDGDITEQEKQEQTPPRTKPDNSDTVTIDSDFGVAVNSRGHVVHNYNPDEDGGEDEDEDEENSAEEEYESEEEFGESESDADMGSNDSEFTDLDNDSMMDSSLLMDSTYTDNREDSFSFVRTSNVSEFDPRKGRKKKKADPFDQHTIPKTSIRARSSSVSHNKSYLGISALGKKPTLQFEKIEPTKVEHPKDSNLSSLIHSKYRSNNINPLNYYSFVDASHASSHKAVIDIFVPPNTKASIKNLAMVDNIAISDCIGFVLLHLCKIPEFSKASDFAYLNPNHWRLELVDEDGENYGSFGILDRTRLLSSYNNPKELAICKVTNKAEMAKNESQSPLPLEFKNNLESFQRRRRSINQIVESEFGDSSTEKIELQIGVFEYDGDGLPKKQSIKVPSDYSMGQVLKEFCSQHGLVVTKYRFKMVDQSTGQSRFVRDVEKCGNLSLKILELIPLETRYNLIIESSYNNGMIEAKITPLDYTLPNITPNADQLDEKMNKISLLEFQKPSGLPMPLREQDRKTSVNSTNSIKQAITSNKYLDDILKGNNPELPINLNTIYFKWKVLKNNSKMKIKNFSEKNFIIDGDYIHLTPPDDLTLRVPGAESSVGNNLGGHHHHNYLNHQFNKNHNKQLSKTYSFHITQILKLKQYVKNPSYFRIIIKSQQSMDDNTVSGTVTTNGNTTNTNNKEIPMKKFYLIAANESECLEIISKLKWVLQVYSFSSGGL